MYNWAAGGQETIDVHIGHTKLETARQASIQAGNGSSITEVNSKTILLNRQKGSRNGKKAADVCALRERERDLSSA